jgi:hypothetical protein
LMAESRRPAKAKKKSPAESEFGQKTSRGDPRREGTLLDNGYADGVTPVLRFLRS